MKKEKTMIGAWDELKKYWKELINSVFLSLGYIPVDTLVKVPQIKQEPFEWERLTNKVIISQHEINERIDPGYALEKIKMNCIRTVMDGAKNYLQCDIERGMYPGEEVFTVELLVAKRK